MNMIDLVKEIYQTYSGDSEGHKLRVWSCAIFSIVLAIFGTNFSNGSIPLMVSVISILAGFSFTALFSSHALAAADLPKPRNEDDRYDIKRLKILSNNFRIRSRYFILIAIFDVLLLTISVMSIENPLNFSQYLNITKKLFYLYQNFSLYFVIIAKFINTVLHASGCFLFFESIYTFYRLAETIIAMMNTRREYLEGARD